MEHFGDFVSETMDRWMVPGLAVAVVKDGEVILSEGYGLRDREKGLEVTRKTLFPIASTTKAFTTMAMGILVDEGRLDWDKPVREYLPAFRLYDALATEHVTPRDLVTHRTGVPRHDLAWSGSPLSRQELVHRLRYLEPNKSLRSAWQYNNWMYMVAGYLVGEIAGTSWEEFVQERILDPLGMADTCFSVRKSQESTDVAFPYAENDGLTKRIAFETLDAVGPAGSMNSNVADMARWLQLHLNGGTYKGRRVVSEATLREMHSPQVLIREHELGEGAFRIVGTCPETSHMAYGLGWATHSYQGQSVVCHSGGIDGFTSHVALMPREGLGVVVLCNLNRSYAPIIVAYDSFDRLLGLEPFGWSDHVEQERARAQENLEKTRQDCLETRRTGTRPSHPLEEYTGIFEHPGYGAVSVTFDGTRLKAEYNSMTLSLTHYHFDVFEHTLGLDVVPTCEGVRLTVSFFTDARGSIGSLSIPFAPEVNEIVFTRKPA